MFEVKSFMLCHEVLEAIWFRGANIG
ncbi:MAG: hypothetical protein D0531_13675 [Methylococcales bacterium]|nr:MAG: hypothetical protein D0531_13675 [Methylococcales bacterium]